MIYKAIGIMSGSSLDGLDIAYVHFHETGGKWNYEILHADCMPYSGEWHSKLKNAVHLSALDYMLLHTAYGRYIGEQVNIFIEKNQLQHKVDLIASHGHTTFHLPKQGMTGQIGDGATVAAVTGLPVVSDLRAMDVAFGGEGAPIVPIGEKLLFGEYSMLLNLGGIANISFNNSEKYIAFDVCPANRVLNMLAQEMGKEFDEDGNIAATGKIHEALLNTLNSLEYYKRPYPKSLANNFGNETVFPLIKQFNIPVADALRTMTEHIAQQIKKVISDAQLISGKKMLVTGGGAMNRFLINTLKEKMQLNSVELAIPDTMLVKYKEALIMGLIGVLRWREEYNVLASVTGAKRNSINGAIWLGNEA